MNETSSTDLMDLCKKFDIECHGCYTPDELSELKKGNYILNLNGTSHWCGLIVGEPSVYFDSFGFPPDQKIEDMMDKYIYNPYDIQALPSSSCGYFVIAFLKWMNGKKEKEKAFKLFLQQFSNRLRKNEYVLENMLKN